MATLDQDCWRAKREQSLLEGRIRELEALLANVVLIETNGATSDGCVRIGTIDALLPDAPGRLSLDLTFEADDLKVSNNYESAIAPDS